MDQKQLYYRAASRSADADKTFLEIVKQGLTRKELQHNIDKRPALWSRFSNWLDKLPDK